MLGTGFVGKTVVITGAGGGLGSALVSSFEGKGARVIGCDVTLDSMVALSLEAKFTFDLLDGGSIASAARQILEATGCPDVLVNNAGWTRAETVPDLTPDNIKQEIDLNLTGVMSFTDPIAAAMSARKQGSIVFVSSVNALAHFGNPAYASAKAGINAYARSLAVELGCNGVRANVVAPGSIRTPAWDHRLEKDAEIPGKLRRLYPLGRLVNAAEVAEAAAFLASDLASGITGTVVPVDAGLTAGCLPFINEILG
jgi:NAD(P)-dependent dehydrogenase (short-subunit alcohol dehydrogenase family)